MLLKRNSNYSADNIDLNVDLQGSNQLTFRFGNKSETYNVLITWEMMVLQQWCGISNLYAHTFQNGEISTYGTYWYV